MKTRTSRDVCAALCLIVATLFAIEADARTLNVLTWSDYIDPVIVSEFEAKHGAEITFTYFDSDEARDQILAASDGRGYDVLMVNRLQLPKYVSRGWLRPVTVKQVPNRRHIAGRWDEALGKQADYGVAYFWGTQGIAYRQDLYPAGISSWKALLDPPAALSGHILMPEFTRELIGVALKAAGHSANHADSSALDAAGERLLRQKPHVALYGYPDLDETSALLGEQIWLSPMYNGDALTLQALNEHIAFVVPDEGALLWADYLTVSAHTREPELAFALIDYLNEPDVAARLASWVMYASPNEAARAYLSDAFLNNTLIYPKPETLRGAEWLEALPPRAQRRVNRIGAQLLLSP